MRAPLAAIALLLLSGCWEGDLYSDADARPAIAPGRYQLMSEGQAATVAHVTILPSGMTRLTVEGRTENFPVRPLDPDGQLILLWSEGSDTEPRPDHAEIYSVARRGAQGDYLIYSPRCDGEEMEIARAAGATIESGRYPACHFNDRASLERALRALRLDPDRATAQMVPIADGQG